LEYIKDLNLEEDERKRLNNFIEENRIICGKMLDVGICIEFIKINSSICR
jgi:hypothetical protein